MKEGLKIELGEQHFIAAGIYCECYENPSNNDECIKLPLAGKKPNQRLKEDISYYNKLHKREANLEYVADYLGTCETSRGIGYIYDCVRDFDGSVSKRLQHYLDHDDEIQRENLWDEMGQLASYLLENKILISDLHARNILIQVNEKREIKPVIVDGIGDRVAIELLNLLPGFVEAKIKRRWNRFAEKELGGQAVFQ